jgi:hypothetical protein
MANVFKNAVANNVTTVTTVYTVPAATTATVIGLVIANDSGADTTATVEITDDSAAVTVKLCASTPIPAASNLNVLNTNNRLVLEAADLIKVTAAASCDVIVSVMEMT